MPRAPKKCARDGCETRGLGRYCPEHRSQWGHGSSGRRNTSEEKAWRAAVLRRAEGVCEIRGPHCTHRATEADHIVNLARGGAPLDLSNGQAACSTCHREKTLREAAEGRRRG